MKNILKIHRQSLRQHGFTLIEMTIVVAVLALLALIAIPSFSQRMRTANLDMAAQVVLKDAQYMEKWYGKCGYYTSNGSNNCGSTAWPTLPYSYAPESGSALYLICFTSYSSFDPNSYRLIATPICGTTQARLGCVCVDQDSNVIKGTNSSCNNSTTLCPCVAASAICH